MNHLGRSLLLVVVVKSVLAHSFVDYVPDDESQHYFRQGDAIPFFVDVATSTRTLNQIKYDDLPFCRPVEGLQAIPQNIGKHLTFHKIYRSPYKIRALQDGYCQALCQVKLTAKWADRLQSAIQQEYQNNWIIDNHPSAAQVYDFGSNNYHGSSSPLYSGGFPLGFVSSGKTYVFNHHNIHIEYETLPYEMYRIVGFTVEPYSISHTFDKNHVNKEDMKSNFLHSLVTCSTSQHLTKDGGASSIGAQPVTSEAAILYTYDVTWKESSVHGQNRWDLYSSKQNEHLKQVRWISLVNSWGVVFFLLILLLIILSKHLKHDLAAYSATNIEDIAEDKNDHLKLGWLLLSGDVFRGPRTHALSFSTLIGTGAQLATATLLVLLQLAAGMLSPDRGGYFFFWSVCFNTYSLCGCVCGYISSRLYQTLGGRDFRRSTIAATAFFPTAVLVYYTLRILLSQMGISRPSIVVFVLTVYFGIHALTSIAGSHFGWKHGRLHFPHDVNSVTRAIPAPKQCIRRPLVIGPVIGLITFGSFFIEFKSIWSAMWLGPPYNEPVFALVTFFLMIIAASAGTILSVYLILCTQNHQIWWFSFLCPGSIGFYVVLYSFVWYPKLMVQVPSGVVIYFSTMAMIAVALSLLCGSIGFVSCMLFTRRIYHAIPRNNDKDAEGIQLA